MGSRLKTFDISHPGLRISVRLIAAVRKIPEVGGQRSDVSDQWFNGDPVGLPCAQKKVVQAFGRVITPPMKSRLLIVQNSWASQIISFWSAQGFGSRGRKRSAKRWTCAPKPWFADI